jgi:hypothetical protein
MKEKNIWLLPTNPNDETGGGIWIKKTRDWCNIYITSSEEIKERDAYITKNGEICKSHNGSKILILKTDKKVIITSDEELITNGVKSIEEKFLQWFVKNSDCESVKVDEINLCTQTGLPCGMQCLSEETCNKNISYKITIPQEEPKEEFPQLGTKEFNNLASAYFGGKPQEEFKPIWKQIIEDCGGEKAFMEAAGLKPKQDRTCSNICSVVCGECQIFEPKQETLEELYFRIKPERRIVVEKRVGDFFKNIEQKTLEEAKKYLSNEGYGKGSNFTLNNVANLMIEWQQEQDKKMYSKEEVNEIIAETWNSCEDNESGETFTMVMDRIMKQFKNN